MTMPAISPETFPYRRKWTKSQLDEILTRKDRLVYAMTDAVGPVGQMLMLPPDMIHILALHMALAGSEVRDELAYIVSKPIEPDPEGKRLMFADAQEWVLKSEYQPGPPDPDETVRKAKAAADQIRRQLDPEVAEALAALMAEQFAQTDQDDTPIQHQIADGLALEDELRNHAQDPDPDEGGPR